MSTVRLAFYKAPGTLFDRLIRWRTGSPYSHVEIVLSSGWYTSSNRDGGVRRSDAYRNPDSWDFVEVIADAARVIQLYARTQGQGYDWLGIAGQAVGIPRIHSAGRWTCSEWCAEALGLSRAYRYTPADLWAHAKKPAG